MRNVFNALMKIIGLWMVCLGILNLVTALSSILNLANASQYYKVDYFILLCAIYLIAAGLRFVFAWVLIFKTDWVANRLKVSKDETLCQPLDRSILFPMGIQLLGLYFLLTAIPTLLHAVARHGEISVWSAIGFSLPWMAQACLSAICIFKADAIVKFITDKANVKWTKLVVITLLGIGFAILIFYALMTWARETQRPSAYKSMSAPQQECNELDAWPEPTSHPVVVEDRIDIY